LARQLFEFGQSIGHGIARAADREATQLILDFRDGGVMQGTEFAI